MNNRILDLSEAAAKLSVDSGALLIEVEGRPGVRVPFADLAVVLSAHPQNRLSHAALSGIASAGAVFVACDEKRLPVGMMLPLQANFVQGERFVRQAEAPLPRKKRAWQALVQAKVRAQARLLDRLGRPDTGLAGLASKVRSGDPANVEAQAAKRYWAAMFMGIEFRRDPDAMGVNSYLNYGYAVLRSMTARSICAAGLHPGLGLHHHNRYDAFALADDLMEPFRPLVDEAAELIVRGHGADAPLDREKKAFILGHLGGTYEAWDEGRSLFDWLSRLSASLVKIYAGEAEDLEVPEIERRRA